MRPLIKGGVYSRAEFISKSLFLNHWQQLLYIVDKYYVI